MTCCRNHGLLQDVAATSFCRPSRCKSLAERTDLKETPSLVLYSTVHMCAFELPSQAISCHSSPEPTMETSFSTVGMCSCVYELQSIMRKDAVNEVKNFNGFDETKVRPSQVGLRIILRSLRSLITTFREAAESDNATELVPPEGLKHQTLLHLVIWQSPEGHFRLEHSIDYKMLERGPDAKICRTIVDHLAYLCRDLEWAFLEDCGDRHYVGRVQNENRGDSARQACIAHPSPPQTAPDCSSSAGSLSEMSESDVETATLE